MIRMKVSERFALNQWLSDYPDDLSYDDIIAKLEHEDSDWRVDGIVYWEVVEHFMAEQVAEFIDDTRRAFESSADCLSHSIKLSDVMEGACDE